MDSVTYIRIIHSKYHIFVSVIVSRGRINMKHILFLALTIVFLLTGCVTTTTTSWDSCVKSSNWTHNAGYRIMNVLSPMMPDDVFDEHIDFIKSRGCNTMHLILCNKADGEYAGYCIYGTDFNWNINDAFCDVMLKRIKKIHQKKLNIVIWLTTDDSSAWNEILIQKPAKYISDLKAKGFFKYASTVVIGLEANEYWTMAQCNAVNAALKSIYGGPTGIHQTAFRYDYAPCADIMFYQITPGCTPEKIALEVKKVITVTGKPVNMFETDRNENRELSEAALRAGAFAVGNW